MKLILLFFSCFIISGVAYCQKKELKKSPLDGTWIEMKNRKDTIIFLSEYEGQYPHFELRRGFDIYNKIKRPKMLSGSYDYVAGNNSLAVRWFLSNDITFHSYYFKMTPKKDKFRMGDFFRASEEKMDTLTFFRIK